MSLIWSGKTSYKVGTGDDLIFNALPNGMGNGGNIYVSTGGNLQIDAGGLNNLPGANGSGGILNIASVGNLNIATDLNTAGNGTGAGASLTLSSGGNLTAGNLTAGIGTNLSYGNVSIFANGKTAFQIGGTTPANGTTGVITGGNILISNASGITLNNTLSANGSNAAVEFDTTTFNNTAGTITGETALTINSGSGNLSIIGAATGWGAPSTVNLLSGGSLNAGPLFTGTAGDSSLLASASNINISAKGALTLGSNAITANSGIAAPANLTISAASITPGSTTSPLILSAFGTTFDGNVSLTETGTSALTLGTAGGQVQISVQASATPGANNGGSVYVSNGGNLTYTTGGILTDSGTVPTLNTNLTLLSGKNLQVQNFTQNLVNTANLVFGSNSSTAFTIAAGATNGIQFAGTLQANNLTISNAGGNIGAPAPNQLTVDAAGLTLNAKGAVYAVDANTATNVVLGPSSGSSFALTVDNGNLSQASGLISTKSLVLTANNFSGAITTNAATVSGAATGPKSIWNVVDTSTGAVTLNAVSAGVTNSPDGVINFQTAGALTTTGSISAANLVLIAANGITVNGTAGEVGGATALNAGGGKSAIIESKTGLINGTTPCYAGRQRWHRR